MAHSEDRHKLTNPSDGNYGCRMPLHDIRRALDTAEQSQTQLDELAAVDQLTTLAVQLRRVLILAAGRNGYSGAEIARAAGGMTREAVNKMLRRERRAAPEPEQPAAGADPERRES